MTALPEGLHDFLENASWGGSDIHPIPGDASFRRYFRIRNADRSAMLMYAPPPEDPQPFLDVGQWLADHGQRAPEIFAHDAGTGWVLIEDFGDDRMRDWLDDNPDGELAAYEDAVDALIRLHQKPAGPFAPYDMNAYLREVALLPEWYAPEAGLDVDTEGFIAVWQEVLTPLLDRQRPGVTVLRDYHAENIMLLGKPGGGEQGLIDFQDALVGHPAYDLVSLLQDARRDVSHDLERQMLDRYVSKANAPPDFKADYARLGAQRNAKIVGIFSRLYRRDGKRRYLGMIPRVWRTMERDLKHPALAPVEEWFSANIPQQLRDASGGEIGG